MIFFARPRKDLRGRLIEIGFELGLELAPSTTTTPLPSLEAQRENMDILRDLLEVVVPDLFWNKKEVPTFGSP